MASIMAKRTQSLQVRTAQRTAAIQKAKSEKKEKEAKKVKVWFRCSAGCIACIKSVCEVFPASNHNGTQNLKATGQGWKERPLAGGFWHAGFSLRTVDMYLHAPCKIHSAVQEKMFAFLAQFNKH